MAFCLNCVERNEEEKKRCERINEKEKFKFKKNMRYNMKEKVLAKLIREGRIRCKRNYPFGKKSKTRVELLFCRTCKCDEFTTTRDEAVDIIKERKKR